MTKCLSCGHFRHDLELNCPKCGSFYSTIVDNFPSDNFEQNKPAGVVSKIKQKIECGKAKMVTKKRYLIIGTVIFLIIAVIFL